MLVRVYISTSVFQTIIYLSRERRARSKRRGHLHLPFERPNRIIPRNFLGQEMIFLLFTILQALMISVLHGEISTDCNLSASYLTQFQDKGVAPDGLDRDRESIGTGTRTCILKEFKTCV